MTVIPLWQHLSYNPGQARLQLAPQTSSVLPQKSPADFVLINSIFSFKTGKYHRPKSHFSQLETSFICPVTNQRLSDCSCIHSSLKLHDFCVFCPAAGLPELGS